LPSGLERRQSWAYPFRCGGLSPFSGDREICRSSAADLPDGGSAPRDRRANVVRQCNSGGTANCLSYAGVSSVKIRSWESRCRNSLISCGYLGHIAVFVASIGTLCLAETDVIDVRFAIAIRIVAIQYIAHTGSAMSRTSIRKTAHIVSRSCDRMCQRRQFVIPHHKLYRSLNFTKLP